MNIHEKTRTDKLNRSGFQHPLAVVVGLVGEGARRMCARVEPSHRLVAANAQSIVLLALTSLLIHCSGTG